MKVSFVIPVYGQLRLTEKCVESLKRTAEGVDYELIIVDDASDEETKTGLERLRQGAVKLLRNPKNSGFARSCNLGAAAASGELLFLLNNDLELTQGWLEPMLRAFRRIKRLGIIGNVQLNAATREIDHAGFYVDWTGELKHKRSENRSAFGAPTYSRFSFVTGACCAIRRNLFLSAGGFDETFENGCEDIDICFRLRQLGYEHFVANRSVVLHHVSATREKGSLREEKNFRLLQRRWSKQIARDAALKWPDHYVQALRSQPRLFTRAVGKDAIARWLGVKKGPSNIALKIVASRLEQNERHWKSLLEDLDDEAIKHSESSVHANWLKESFSFDNLNFDTSENEGPWIREEANISIPKGNIASTLSVAGRLRPASAEIPQEKGELGLRITVNECQSIVTYPLPIGEFEIEFPVPPIVVHEPTRIRLQLVGAELQNAYAFLGRKIENWFIFPKSIRNKLSAYRPQRKNRRLSLYGLKINGEQVLDFKTDPSSPLNFDYVNRHGNIGINLAGWFKAELGIGESARLAAKAIRTTKIKHSIVPLKVNCLAAQGDSTYDRYFSNANPYPINIFHIDAPQSPDIDHYHGQSFRDGKYNIAYWAWELPDFPDAWVKYFKYYDEIWTPSNFVRDAIAMKSPHPVITVPHCIEFAIPDRNYRALLNLPTDKFLFCFAYDLNSYQERKNPKATIQAFKAAFSGSPSEADVGLVIKTHSIANNPESYKELLAELEGVSNYYLIDRTLSREMLYGLIKCCDSYVSLHRSEGFGLTVAESMYLSKPVLSTDWSATSEFLNSSNGCPVDFSLTKLQRSYGPYQKGQLWAEPSIHDAAAKMVRLFESPELCERLGANARRTIQDLFSPQRIGAIYEKRLKAITQW
mgnify:CR=1 FL=1